MIAKTRMLTGLLGLVSLVATGTGCHRATSTSLESMPRPPERAPRPSAPPSSSGSGSAETTAPTSYRPHRLSSWFRALQDAESPDRHRRVSILHVGDSHTASDTLTGRLRELLQERFGAAGRGYALPGEPWETFRQEQMSYEMSDHWTTHLVTDDEATPPFGIGGARLVSDHEDAWLMRGTCDRYCSGGTSMDGFAIHYLVQKEGGSFEVSVDGASPTRVDTEGPPRELGVFRRGLPPGPHEIRLEVQGDGPVALFGIYTSNGRDGIEYTSLGLNGATAVDWTRVTDSVVVREVSRLAPDLLIFAFGTNEAYNLHHMRNDPAESLETITHRMATYQRQFTEMIQQYRRGAPGAACLVLLPPDVAPRRDEDTCERRRVAGIPGEVCVPSTLRSLPGIMALQRAAARRAGCSLWNQSHAMGGEGSIATWSEYAPPLAQSDGVHLTMRGYDTLAEALFRDLMRTYDLWRSGGHIPLKTEPIPTESKILAFP